MKLAMHIASWSKDRSTKVGCVIVGPFNEVRSLGYNGFPRGIDDNRDDRHERPQKYAWTEHAERNAIYHAAMIGIPLRDCRMYLPWFPCIDCARAIIQSGISELIAFEPDLEHKTWGADFLGSLELLKEAGVAIRFISNEPT